MTKGKIPIQKNITVIDEQGNIYEATYPKRAKGLVKNGVSTGNIGGTYVRYKFRFINRRSFQSGR